MNGYQKSLIKVLAVFLLLSQVHLSVYAIHCLCTGEIHLSLTAEKECDADACILQSESCCSDSNQCSAEELNEDKENCHAPKATIEFGIDLDGALVHSPLLEADREVHNFTLPLFLLFGNLKIPTTDSFLKLSPGHPPEKSTQFRYILNSEMLC
ncbi:MAG: hypothetical protein EA411_12785 [Saprospirales bacterium]|nr:MAG: hypothetical protein EA411_12785 [Saprospirales bacterium]